MKFMDGIMSAAYILSDPRSSLNGTLTTNEYFFPLQRQAVRRGSTVVGIQGKDCVVLAVEKRAIAK